MADFTVKLTITGDGTVAVRAVEQVSAATRNMGAVTGKASRQTEQGFRVVAKGAADLSAEASRAQSSLASLLKLAGGVTALRLLGSAFISAADDAGQLRARMQFATRSAQEYAAAQARIDQIARMSYKSVSDITEIFVRSAEPMRQLGMATQTTLDLTEALSLGLVVSGADAQASASAIDAFGRAMQTGTLRGIEFNTVIQRAPAFAEALERALGKSRAELIEMANSGQLTVRELAAVGSQLDVLRAQSEAMPATLEDAMTRFHDSFMRFADAANTSTGAINGLVKTADFAGDHIGQLVTIIGLLVAAHVADRVASGLLQAAQRAAAASALAEAEAQMVKLRATGAATVGTDALAAAEARLTQAQLAATAAGVGRAGALATMGARLSALAGGPIGIAVLAFGGLAMAIHSVIQAEKERQQAFAAGIAATQQTTASVAELTAQIERAKQGYDTMPDFGAMADTWSTASAELAQRQAELAEQQDRVARLTEAVGDGVGSLTGRLARARDEAASLSTVVDGLREQLEKLDWDAYWNPTAAAVAGDQAEQALASLTARAKEAEQQNARTAQSQIEYWQALAATRIEQERARGATEAQIAAMRAENAVLLATIADSLKQPAETPQSTFTTDITDITRAQDAQNAAFQNAAANVQELHDKLAGATDAEIDFGNAVRAANTQMLETIAAGGDAAQALATFLATADRLQQAQDLSNQLSGLRALQQSYADNSKAVDALKARLAGLSPAQQRYNATVKANAAAWKEAGGAANIAATMARDAADAQAAQVLDLGQQLEDMAQLQTLSDMVDRDFGFDRLTAEVNALQKALDGAFGPLTQEQVAKFQTALSRIQMRQLTTGAIDALRAVQAFTKEGAQEYAAMEIAIDALSIAQAVSAVLNQGTGDPYSAFARMAAMAATVAPLLANIGQSISGVANSGFTDTAKARQQAQGTGSVLGDASAKSESIVRATEITAQATNKLVAINTGMLRALQSLQQAIGGASGMLARGAGQMDVNPADFAVRSIAQLTSLPGTSGRLAPNVLLGGLPDLLNLFGGKSKITDQGVKIVGGTISDLIENIMVQAYTEVQSKSWAFGSTHTKEVTDAIDGAFAKQFQLILQSIADTVREGAAALGLLPAEIEAAISQFQIAEQHISLKGLSAEEQQKELEAVFSQIFDGLAGAVVPFVAQFQGVGEGLGETLVRVATEVQVTQEAMRQLGLVIDTTDPERFAQIADGLVQVAGGIEDLASGMQSFVNAFAPAAYKQDLALQTLSLALEQVGLAVPSTRDGMWELMQSLDASTEAGRQQIATLLRLADVADQYYDTLEKATDKQAQAIAEYVDTVLGLQAELGRNPLGQTLAGIVRWSQDTARHLDDLAVAAGRAGASERDLALVHQVAVARTQAAIGALMDASASLVQQLYGHDGAATALSGFGRAINNVAQKARDATNLLIGDLSPYTDREKLQIALEGQRAGTVAPEDVLRIAQRLMASGADYRQVFDEVMAIGDRTQGARDSANYARTANAASSIAEKTLSKAERYQLADQLANNIADAASAQGLSFAEVADRLNLSLSDLGQDLGLSNEALDAYLEVLASDNFGLQDLDDILGAQVNRLIDAILDQARDSTTRTPGPEIQVTGSGGTAAFNPITVNLATDKPLKTDPALLDQVQTLNEHTDAQAKMLAELLSAIRDHTRDAADGINESVRLERDAQNAPSQTRRSRGVPTL